jgi:hypothetical protein
LGTQEEGDTDYGTIQIPVDSSEETLGGGRMVICTRILKIHHHPAPTRGNTMKFINTCANYGKLKEGCVV